MLVQPTEDEGAPSERPSEAQPIPSPIHTSEVPVELQTDPFPRPSPSTTMPDSIPESSGGNLGGHSFSDKSLLGNEGEMTLQSVYDLCLSLCAQVYRESVSKQGRKFAKGEPSIHKDPLFDKIPEDTLDYMETEDAQDVGKTRDVVDEEKENDEDVLSTKDVLSTSQQKVSTDKEKVSTDRPIVSTDGSKVSTVRQKYSTDEQNKGTDDQIKGTDEQSKAQVLLNMSQAKAVSREKEKGVEFKDIEETDKPRPTSIILLLTLKPLPKIDPKDKGKKKIEEEDESESESDGILEAEKKFKQLAKLRPDRILAEKLQEEEREQLNNRRKANFFHDTISAQKKIPSQNTSEDDSEKENDELRLCLTIAPDEDKEVDYEILDKNYPIIEGKTEYLGTKPQRCLSTLMRVLSIFDRDDLNVVYQLVMDRYQDEIPEGFDRVLWGDLMIMFNPDDEDKFWNSQQDWNVVSWKLHGSSGVHTLMTEAGLVIHMLVEKKYPLRKKVLLQMLELKLESEEDSTMALELIRFVKKLVAELEPEDSDDIGEDKVAAEDG
ncbi:hypothetical protein Tco_1203607 [Tanacetum coccineum]